MKRQLPGFVASILQRNLKKFRDAFKMMTVIKH